MSEAHENGKIGEQYAARLLEEKGYEIVEQNWRFSRAEIDLIARDGDVLVFVEVKTRSSNFYGPPESFVSRQQQRMLVDAANVYMSRVQHNGEIRFDVVSVLLRTGKQPLIRHLEDAFFPRLG